MVGIKEMRLGDGNRQIRKIRIATKPKDKNEISVGMGRRSFPPNFLTILFLTLIALFVVILWAKRNAHCRVKRGPRTVDYGGKELEARMKERRRRMRSLCERWADHEEAEPGDGCKYKSKEVIADQRIGSNFLLDAHSGTLYCYAHKVCAVCT